MSNMHSFLSHEQEWNIGSIISLNQYTVTFQQLIGQGGFSLVYLVTNNTNNMHAVLKRIAVADSKELQRVEYEIEYHKLLSSNRHDNIVGFYDYKISSSRRGGYEVLILMEHCQEQLIDILNANHNLQESEILHVFSHVCNAIALMHSQSPPIIHRDIKIENVLYSSSGTYKLCDFGSCTTTMYQQGQLTNATEIRKIELEISKTTTLAYRAPELCDFYQKRAINEKIDIWALGVLLYKLCYYITPFEESGKLAILNGKFTFPTFPCYSLDLLNLIRSLLQVESEKRPSITKIRYILEQLSKSQSPISIQTTPFNVEPRLITPSILVKKESIVKYEHQNISTSPITPMRRGRPVKESVKASLSSQDIREFHSLDSNPSANIMEDPFISISKRASIHLEELDPFSQLAIKSVSKASVFDNNKPI